MWCKQLPVNVKWFTITHSSTHCTNNLVLAAVVVVVIVIAVIIVTLTKFSNIIRVEKDY